MALSRRSKFSSALAGVIVGMKTHELIYNILGSYGANSDLREKYLDRIRNTKGGIDLIVDTLAHAESIIKQKAPINSLESQDPEVIKAVLAISDLSKALQRSVMESRIEGLDLSLHSPALSRKQF